MNPDRSIPIVSTSGELAVENETEFFVNESAKAAVAWEIAAKEKRARILATMESLGIVIASEFVPLSKSRNRDEKEMNSAGKPSKRPRLSLNWRVTVKCNGRDLLTTDYSAGCAHAPAYKLKAPSARCGVNDKQAAIAWECENGFRARFVPWGISKGGESATPILPDSCDVLYALVIDSEVLDFGDFESWAADFGYDPDSRAAEKIYRACLDIALKLRNGIGDAGLANLREAFTDY